MKTDFLTSKSLKFLLPFIALALAIGLWRNGYEFGQWLHAALH